MNWAKDGQRIGEKGEKANDGTFREFPPATCVPKDHSTLKKLSRRSFLSNMGAITLAVPGLSASSQAVQKKEPPPNFRLGGRDLFVKPILIYSVYRRVEGTSWRAWTGLETEQDAKKETERISKELSRLRAEADFPMRILPVAKISSPSQVAQLKDIEAADALLVYAAGGWTDLLQTLIDLKKPTVIFVRYKSGPYYLWHEIVHARFLRMHTDKLAQTAVDFEDVVVDDYAEMLWRLRAIYGLINTIGRRIIAIGGPGGWAHPPGVPSPPELARLRFQLEMITVTIPDLVGMIEAARKDATKVERARQAAEKYLRQKNISLHTKKEFVDEAFLLTHIFEDLLKRHDAFAITVGGCMGSYANILPCLTLSLLNDFGYMAYCESDFVVIPSGILLHFISGKPTFFCNPTYLHKGTEVFAHCTAPRCMDGKTYEPAKILTHYESDHGAAPKVEMRKGQLITVVNPDFEAKEWIGFIGKITDTPFLPICRSQIEVKIIGDWQRLINERRGFHCMIAYGDYRKEVGYALKKVGIGWKDMSK